MAITRQPPNTIYLGGGDGPGGESGMTVDNEHIAYETILPGDLIERVLDGGAVKWRKHATADQAGTWVALEQIEMNLGVDSPYAPSDLVKAGNMHRGSFFWGRIGSGQDIVATDRLQSAGDGKFKAVTAGAKQTFLALDGPGPVTGDTFIRLEVE